MDLPVKTRSSSFTHLNWVSPFVFKMMSFNKKKNTFVRAILRTMAVSTELIPLSKHTLESPWNRRLSPWFEGDLTVSCYVRPPQGFLRPIIRTMPWGWIVELALNPPWEPFSKHWKIYDASELPTSSRVFSSMDIAKKDTKTMRKCLAANERTTHAPHPKPPETRISQTARSREMYAADTT